MHVKALTIGCAICALAATSEASEFRLDDAAMDRVVAGVAETGIEVLARTGPDSDNFSESTAGLLFFGKSNRGANARVDISCQGPSCSSTGSLALASLENEVPLLDLDFGEFLPIPDGEGYGGYGLADGGFNRLDAVAFGPTGTAETTAKVIPIVRSDAVSATIGFGRGKTTGDGQSDIDGVVRQGQGVGQGYAIKSPTGNTILFGVAVAVDPSAIIGNLGALANDPQ